MCMYINFNVVRSNPVYEAVSVVPSFWFFNCIVFKHYRNSSVIRRSFVFFQNNPKILDPSCKTDLDLWDCLGRVKLAL